MKLLNNTQLSCFPLILLLIAPLMIFQSCLTTNEVQQAVDSKYQNIPDNIPADNDWYEIETPEGDTIDGVANCIMRRSSFVPLIFYWSAERVVDCYLSTTIPVSILQESLQAFHDTVGITDFSNNAKLHIQINEFPGRLSYHKENEVILMLFLNSFTLNERAYPYTMQWEIDYQLHEDGKELISGTISQRKRVPGKPKGLNSTQQHIKDHLKEYENHNKKLITELIQELNMEMDEQL